jgi:hypothetical protein
MPLLYFVQDTKGNFVALPELPASRGENLPYRKCCKTVLRNTTRDGG